MPTTLLYYFSSFPFFFRKRNLIYFFRKHNLNTYIHKKINKLLMILHSIFLNKILIPNLINEKNMIKKKNFTKNNQSNLPIKINH